MQGRRCLKENIWGGHQKKYGGCQQQKSTEVAGNKNLQSLPASKKDWDFPVQKLASSLVAAKELMER